MSEKHGMNSADTNALPCVLHAIVQRRPRAQLRAEHDAPISQPMREYETSMFPTRYPREQASLE